MRCTPQAVDSVAGAIYTCRVTLRVTESREDTPTPTNTCMHTPTPTNTITDVGLKG